MSDIEVKSAIDNLGHAFEEFKKANDARLKEIEKKGSADGLLTEKVNKINDAMEKYEDVKSRLEKLETTTAADFADAEKAEGLAGKEYKSAFLNYIKKGTEINLSALEQKALSAASDPDGGYLVTPVMSDRIIKKVFETSPMRRVANVITIGTDQLDFIVDNDEAAASWTTEQGTRSTTNTPTLDKKSIYVHELYAKPKATQKLLDDSFVDAEAWLADKIADIISRTENTAFIAGSGVGQPQGILSYTAGTSWGQIEQISSTSGTGGTLDADDFAKMYYGVKEEYQRNFSWLMNRSTVKSARLLKENTTNQYIWQPGLERGSDGMLYGAPVIQCTDMPVLATNSLSIAGGDFNRGYQIVDRIGIRILRDPFSAKPFIEFYTTKRVGGGVTNFEAIKLLKMDT